jgi:signal transduction histidine kinase/CheY-like chemotaxis protein
MNEPEVAHAFPARGESLDLPAIRLLVLERMLWVWSLFGGLIVAVVATDDLLGGRYRAAAFYAAAYVFVVICLMPRPFPYSLRSTLPLVMLFVVGSHEIYYHGLDSAGTLFYYALIIFTCILLGARAAAAVTLAAVAGLCGISYLYALRTLSGSEVRTFLDHLHVRCLPDVVSLGLLAAMSIAFLSLLLRSLERSVETSQAYLAEIAHERNQLVRIIDERDRVEKQLRQAQKMEAVGQLAGGIAHDFNNLLQVVSAHTEILLRRLAPESDHHRQLQEVRKASERAAALTRQLLAYSRQQVMTPVYLDLNTAVEDLLRMVHRILPEHIERKIDLAAGLGTVYADPGQIEQVLLNLILNARDAMPAGGTLTIQTQNTDIGTAAIADHSGLEPGPWVAVHVSDTGHGIAPADQDHIFEPFYTTKRIGEGTGLGLAMAYGIVKQHAGQILLSSKPHAGSTFTVYLPRVNQPVPAPAAPEKEAPTREEKGTGTILLAEDDESVRELITSVLSDAGFAVFPARDGLEAVELFEKHRDTVDLLLFDVVMPRMGGREACETIRERAPALRTVFMSGYAPEGLNGRLKLDHQTGFIQKPYQTQELLAKVREMLDT